MCHGREGMVAGVSLSLLVGVYSGNFLHIGRSGNTKLRSESEAKRHFQGPSLVTQFSQARSSSKGSAISKTVSSLGDQLFKHMSLWCKFHI